MRVGVYPADKGGCGHYRMIWPAVEARKLGYDITIHEPGTPESNISAVVRDRYDVVKMRDGSTKRVETFDVLGLNEVPPFDVIVLQRPLARQLTDCIPHLQAEGIAVVVELDDDFMQLDPRNTAWHAVQPHLNQESNYRWLRQAIERADLLTVSTPRLRDIFATKHREPIVLPNYLPMHAYSDRGHQRAVSPIVGWSGAISTHPNDLPEAGAVRRVMPLAGGFHVVGTGQGVQRQLGLTEATPFTSSGWVPIDEYHAALDAIDVGIVPLKPSRFNEAKSWLKGLEFAGRGIPSVASPTGPYAQLAALQGCLLGDSPKHWQRTLTKLLADPVYWDERAHAAFEAAWSLNLAKHAHEWPEAWALARAMRQAA